MEQSIHLQRQRTNVDFLDENGRSFAGLYVLQGSSLTVFEALEMIKTCFHLTFSETTDEHNRRQYALAMYPYRFQLTNEVFSVHKLLTKGRYYVVRHLDSREDECTGAWNDYSAIDHVLGESSCAMSLLRPKGSWR